MRSLVFIALFFLCSSLFHPSKSLPMLSQYEPIFMKRSDMEKATEALPARTPKKTGKIYAYQQYLFVVEPALGIHVFNNINPQSPTNITFIQVPGVVDLAVKQNFLYCDNAVDLVTFNISNPAKPVLSSRLRNALPEVPPPDNLALPQQFNKNVRPADLVIIDWKKLNP